MLGVAANMLTDSPTSGIHQVGGRMPCPCEQVSFMVLMYNFSLLFKNVTSSLLYEVDRRTLRIVHHSTILIWSVFPIVRLSAVARLIEQETVRTLPLTLPYP
jgi:hypothetical protein